MKTPATAKWYYTISKDTRGSEDKFRVKAILKNGNKVLDSYYVDTYRTKPEAQRVVKDLQRQQARGNNRVRFSDYSNEYLTITSQSKKWGKTHEDAIRRYLREFNQYIDTIGIRFVDEIRESHIEGFLSNYNHQKIRMRNIRLIHVLAVLRKAQRDRIISEIPQLKQSKEKDKTKTKPFSQSESVEILQHITEHHEWLAYPITFLLMTGMRRREVCLLKWSFIKDDEIIIPANITKASRERRIPLTDTLRKLLEAIPKTDKDDFVFHNASGKRLNTDHITHSFIDIIRGLGYGEGYVLHSLRATFITNALAQGADIIALMDIVGHRQLSTTQGYTSPFKESKKAIMELNILGNPKPKNEGFDYGKIVNFQKRI